MFQVGDKVRYRGPSSFGAPKGDLLVEEVSDDGHILELVGVSGGWSADFFEPALRQETVEVGDVVEYIDHDAGGVSGRGEVRYIADTGNIYVTDERVSWGQRFLSKIFGDEWWKASVEPAPAVAGRPSDWRMYYDDSSQRRKDQPMFSGFLAYCPAAVALVSELSRLGNEKHNPGQPLHHARGKSSDHGDCLLRHQAAYLAVDKDTAMLHAVAVAWRAMIQLQELAEQRYGWPTAPAARFPEE